MEQGIKVWISTQVQQPSFSWDKMKIHKNIRGKYVYQSHILGTQVFNKNCIFTGCYFWMWKTLRTFINVFSVLSRVYFAGTLCSLSEHPLLWLWHSTMELCQGSSEDGRWTHRGFSYLIASKIVKGTNISLMNIATIFTIYQVIGLTTYQLPLLQAGGTGHCFAQCRYYCQKKWS